MILKPFLIIVMALSAVLHLSGCQSLSLFSSPIQKRGVTGFFKDNILRAKIIKALYGKYMGSITLLIHKNRVMVIGYVQSAADHQKVLTILRSFVEISSLQDHLRVGSAPEDPIHDTYLSQSMQSNLFFDTRIASQDYHITASHKILYILGTARSESEKKYVLNHAESMTVRRVISDIQVDEAWSAGSTVTQ